MGTTNSLIGLFYDRSIGGEGGSSGDAIETALRRLDSQRSQLEELWESRKVRLEAGLQLDLFERDVEDVRQSGLLSKDSCFKLNPSFYCSPGEPRAGYMGGTNIRR